MRMRLYILLICVVVIQAQVLTPVHQPDDVPDFGIASGSWGTFQIYRPFGLPGIVMHDHRDLLAFNLANGEPLNLHQGWWYTIEPSSSWDARLHPRLYLPTDSTVSSVEVNYKQSIYGFKDFNLWFHRALSDRVRFGYHSELRLHPRFDSNNPYRHQRHRLQLHYDLDNWENEVEVGMTRLTLPLYVYNSYHPDSSLTFDISQQLERHLYEGRLTLIPLQAPLGIKSFYVDIRSGRWIWDDIPALEWSILGGVKGNLSTGAIALDWDLGRIQMALADSSRAFTLLKMSSSPFVYQNFTMHGGFQLMSPGEFEFSYRLNWQRNALGLFLERRIMLYGPVDFELGGVNIAGVKVHSGIMEAGARFWQEGGSSKEEVSRGLWLTNTLSLPWQMDLAIDYHTLLNERPETFVWDLDRFSWSLDQQLDLFNDALIATLSLWSQHHFQTRPALLRTSDLRFIEDPYTSERSSIPVNRLNYSVELQIRNVTLAYTDLNVLHDFLWKPYVQADWQFEYTPVVNQQPDYTFQYLTLVWRFDG